MKSALTLCPVPDDMLPSSFGARVIKALGGQTKALFVGGCVRNAVLRLPITDIDVATQNTPQDVMHALRLAKISFVPTGLEHGTLTAIENTKPVEVTTLRRDVATDGRRAVVAFTTDWREDALRRDFTMNTLLAAPDGCVFDPLNCGISDTLEGRVVFVGQAGHRIAEDYLRILRFFRMHALYGQGTPDPNALAACHKASGMMGALSHERITAEITKVLEHAPAPLEALTLMWSCDVLTGLQGSTAPLLPPLVALQKKYKALDLPARLYAMAGGVEPLCAFLRLPKATLRAVALLAQNAPGPTIDNPQKARAATYRYGRTAALQIVFLQSAGETIPQSAVSEIAHVIRTWPIPRFALNGHDLVARGVPPGPALGKALAEEEEAWIKRDFQER